MRVLGIGHLRYRYCLGIGIGFLITGYDTTTITALRIQWRSGQDIDKLTQQETQIVSCIGRHHVCTRCINGTGISAIGFWCGPFSISLSGIPALFRNLALWKEHSFIFGRIYRQP